MKCRCEANTVGDIPWFRRLVIGPGFYSRSVQVRFWVEKMVLSRVAFLVLQFTLRE